MKRLIALLIAVIGILHICMPVYALPDKAPGSISAAAAVLIEAGTGKIVWGRNETRRLPMASTTKIMTVLLTLESGDLDSEFTVDPIAVRTEGSSMGLREGDIVSKRDLCIGMLLPSGNDAANCAAVKVGGSIEGFSDMMNAKARELGLKNTHFVTPSGLHDDDHYSTAADMAQLASAALQNPGFAEICSSEYMRLSFGDPPYDRSLKNTNKLLGMYEGCIGVKTGFTDEAGRCLVSAARKNGVTLICVTLNAPDDWNDHIKLFDYGFEAVKAENAGGRSYVCPLAGGISESVAVVTERDIILASINGKTPNVTYSAAVPRMLYAPVKQGDVIGMLSIMYGNRVVDKIPLIAAENAAAAGGVPPEKSIFRKLRDCIKEKLFG